MPEIQNTGQPTIASADAQLAPTSSETLAAPAPAHPEAGLDLGETLRLLHAANLAPAGGILLE
jgi:hypothetical protein